MHQLLKYLLILTCLFSSIPDAEASIPICSAIPAFAKQKSPVKSSLVLEDQSIQPGHPFWIAINLNIEKDWHAYWKNPGGVGFPISIEWDLPSGFTAGDIQMASSRTHHCRRRHQLWLHR